MLVAAGRHNPDVELATWWGERYCKANLGEVVRPDGVGVWREGDATVTFCLEYDRGTEPLGRISAKADDYARLERARLRLGELAGLPRPAESVARAAEAARLRAGEPAFGGR